MMRRIDACWSRSLRRSPAVAARRAQTSRARTRRFAPARLRSTESALYDAVRIAPHDPAARVALGRYLVARGATRVGMTLLEEAIKFGGDADGDRTRSGARVSRGRRVSLARCARSRRRRRSVNARSGSCARESNRRVGFDPVDSVPAADRQRDRRPRRASRRRPTGRRGDQRSSFRNHHFRHVVGRASAPSFRRPTATRDAILAAADSIGLGRMSLLERAGHDRARRRSARRADRTRRDRTVRSDVRSDDRRRSRCASATPIVALPNGTRFVTWSTQSDLQLLQAGGWISVTRPSIARVLREHRWTFDAKRGALIVEPLSAA